MKANYSRLFSMAAAASLAVMMSLSPVKMVAQAPPSPITNFPSWEVASEFNDTTNPSGVWSYCSESLPLGSTCTTLSNLSISGADLMGWNTVAGYPLVDHNLHETAITLGSLPVTFPPRALRLHPGPNGEYAVVRFTAPFTGTYKVSGQFYGLDNNGNGTITDVHILKNSNTTTQVFSGNVNLLGGLPFASFTSKTVALRVGDKLDFAVGYGTDLTYSFDSTGLNAVIEKIK